MQVPGQDQVSEVTPLLLALHRVVHAVTAAAALAGLTVDERLDLIFSDIMMTDP
jgi:hypothetical protein